METEDKDYMLEMLLKTAQGVITKLVKEEDLEKLEALLKQCQLAVEGLNIHLASKGE